MRLLNFGVQSVTAFCITMSPGLGETERQGGGVFSQFPSPSAACPMESRSYSSNQDGMGKRRKKKGKGTSPGSRWRGTFSFFFFVSLQLISSLLLVSHGLASAV